MLKHKFKIKSSDILITLVYLFFVFYQYKQISGLNLSYLGEAISFHIVPYYTLILLLIPVIIYVVVYLPGLLIIKTEWRVNLNSFRVYFEPVIRKKHYFNGLTVQSPLERTYRILRC